jgi:hypothetical protein
MATTHNEFMGIHGTLRNVCRERFVKAQEYRHDATSRAPRAPGSDR